VRRGRHWRTLDADHTNAAGRYALRERLRQPMSAPARVVVSAAGTARARRHVGRVNAFRWANASWYGPGLYGNHLGCGGTLTTGRLGVANKSLPCGTKVTLRNHGRAVRVAVIDRGPYVAGREYDLTAATAQRLRFYGHGAILTTR
jgi:rare lipoprotein A